MATPKRSTRKSQATQVRESPSKVEYAVEARADNRELTRPIHISAHHVDSCEELDFPPLTELELLATSAPQRCCN